MCIHDKVFRDDIILPTLPAKTPWKCSKCGKKGYDTERTPQSMKRIKKELGL